MSLKVILTVAMLSVGLASVQAYAEAEGAGEPFPFRAPPMASTGRPFAVDTGTAAYPTLTGEVTQEALDTGMCPDGGSERPVQSLASLPRGFYDGLPDVTHAQTQKSYADTVLSRKLADR